MTLDATSYFAHLQAYLSDEYIVDDGSSGTVTLTEKFYVEGSRRKRTRKVVFAYRGRAFAIKLDGRKDPLFHFLDDNGRPWSKRCDFIVFQCYRQAIHAHLFEFKTKSLEPTSIIEQLRSGEQWCASLRKVIQQYTGDDRKFKVRKFVCTENENPSRFLDAADQYLAREPSIRHYHFDDIAALTLDDLDNSSVRTV